jgi:hypothetical protein
VLLLGPLAVSCQHWGQVVVGTLVCKCGGAPAARRRLGDDPYRPPFLSACSMCKPLDVPQNILWPANARSLRQLAQECARGQARCVCIDLSTTSRDAQQLSTSCAVCTTTDCILLVKANSRTLYACVLRVWLYGIVERHTPSY